MASFNDSGRLPCNLSQSHFITDYRVSQPVYPLVQIGRYCKILGLSLGMMRAGAHCHLSMEVEWRFGLSEVTRFHTVEGQYIIQDLARQLCIRQASGNRITFSMRARLLDKPSTHSSCSGGRLRNTLSASRFCTDSKAVLSGTRTS
jgi:hypothetical protein